uniref:Transposase n=1 Tax=Arundo donax TaxID=35708 RepID=A0A0A9CWW4_ARUDO
MFLVESVVELAESQFHWIWNHYEILLFKDRTTLENVCAILHISKKKLLRYMRQGLIKRHSSSIKPHLTDENKKVRLQWCLGMLDQDSMPNDPKFKGLFDVFIDEKWFYLTRKSERYYLLADENEPLRTCRSKNNISKIMFLCVTARPRFDENGVCIFDGKIGCFPLVTFERAKRSSVNRPAGTMEVKPIASITRDVIREFMIDKVLPAIRAKWPREDVNKPIYIQQDNAPSHIKHDDPQFLEVAKQDGFDIRVICRPLNSPDFNILDLGFCCAIQAIQYKKVAKTVQDLVPIVQQAFQDYSPRKANRIYLTLQLVWKEAMKVQGSNKYNIPHMKKQSLERQGCLPVQIACEAELVAEASTKLVAYNM